MSSTLHTNIGAHLRTATGAVPAAVSAGTRNGSAIDRTGFGSCKLHVQTGAATGTPTTISVGAKIQDSADGEDFADYVPPNGAAAISAITAANSSASVNVDLSSARRYIRVVETTEFTGGSAPTIGAGSTVVLGGAKTLPAS